MSKKNRVSFDKSLNRARSANVPLDQRNKAYFNLRILAAREAKWWAEVLEMPNDIRDHLAKDFEKIGNKSFANGIKVKQERARDVSVVEAKLFKNCVMLKRSFQGDPSKQADRYALSAIKKIVECVEEVEAMQIMDVIEEGFES